ncbi:hypothetical protein HMPREF0388_1095 [Mobiluncus curtisii ATCC 51333]|uniref:Uncharacterized protein n=1 Tax=Mobiluncus curtisii ATCC 51333 TaxID=887326 RepID=E6LZ08_9ACTO|nr:hypothetical protein HMPREF0388_1095 [Mobiluncus curtisii ATCC 51333]
MYFQPIFRREALSNAGAYPEYETTAFVNHEIFPPLKDAITQ